MGSVVCDLGEVMEGSSGRVLLCGGSVGGVMEGSSGRVLLCGGSVGGGLRCLLEVG